MLEALVNGYTDFLGWMGTQIVPDEQHPVYTSYFYYLIALSVVVWLLEIIFPWRKNQSIFRKDFWLDGFYMFFNFFIFAFVLQGIYNAFQYGFGTVGLTMQSVSLLNLTALPLWAQLLIFFVINDFVQWFTHVMLHRFDVLWRFHRVHHSVVEMGFAAHLRYHWMENILYKPLKTLAVMLIGGFEPDQAFLIHFIAVAIGHLNHANVRITWGPFKYIFNNSVMHLYHHVKALPEDRRTGVNFGISLSLWDYIFKTDYIPQSEDGTYALGFPGIDEFPKHSFWKQLFVGFTK